MRNPVLLASLLLLCSVPAWAQGAAGVEHHSATALRDAVAGAAQAASHLAVSNLGDRGAYNYVLVRRDGSGEVEVHDRLDDVIVVQEGSAVLRYGGTLSGSRESAPGERRGGQIAGGTTRRLAVGDLMIVPAGVPHRVEVDAGSSVTYLVVKVVTAAAPRPPR
jgi:mannose-6-phosphate isomerase-like protein (cupin superfamily)